MNVLQLFSCAVGRHRRDRKLAWHDGDEYGSWCTGCGREMRRSYPGWRLEAHIKQPPDGHRKARVARVGAERR